MSRKGLIGYLAVVLIVVAAAGVGVFYLTGNRASEERVSEEIAQEPTQAIEIKEPKLEIRELKLCYSIDEDFICNINRGREYKPGDTVYLYFEITGLKEIDGKIAYSEDFEVYDPDNNFIAESSRKGIIYGEEDVSALNPPYSVPIKNFLPMLLTDPLGKYTIRLTINDINSGDAASKSVEFELK